MNLTEYLALGILISCISCGSDKIALETDFLKAGINGQGFIRSFTVGI
jgi:hypothetical protein